MLSVAAKCYYAECRGTYMIIENDTQQNNKICDNDAYYWVLNSVNKCYPERRIYCYAECRYTEWRFA